MIPQRTSALDMRACSVAVVTRNRGSEKKKVDEMGEIWYIRKWVKEDQRDTDRLGNIK